MSHSQIESNFSHTSAAKPILLPATRSDIHELARIEVDALSSNLLLRLCFSDLTQLYRSLISSLEQLFESDQTRYWLVKAISEDGELMGWGAWSVRAAESDLRERDMNPYESWMLVTSGAENLHVNTNDMFPAMPGLRSFIHEKTCNVVDDWLAGRRHLVLHGLFVAPKYQRQGVGGAIIQWGNQKADAQDLPCLVHSTPIAYGIYREEGWKEVGVINVDLRSWTRGNVEGMGWGNFRVSGLLRLPRDKREEERVRMIKRLKVAGVGKEVENMVWGVDFM